MSNWQSATIGDLFDFGAGKSVTPQARHGKRKYPFLRTANVFWGRIDVREVDAMHYSDDEIAAKSLRKGDLLVCEGGDIGRAAVWNNEIEDCGFQNHLHRLRPKSSDVIPYFYMYYLQAGFTQLGIYKGAGNKTTIPNLSRSRLASLTVPRLPKEEQKKVVAVLMKIQHAISIEEKLLKAARELKQSAMHKLFSQGLKQELTKLTEIGNFPESWQPVLIGDLGEVVTGTTPKTIERKYYEGGIYPFIAPGDLGITTKIYKAVKTITEAGLNVSRELPMDSICVVCIGSSIGKVGITTQDKSTSNQQINAIITNEKFHPAFICYLLTYLSDYLTSFASQSPVPIMSKGKFEKILVYVTLDKDEQKGMADILSVMDEKIEIHERKRSTLTELFEAALHKLMTGEINLLDLNIDTSDITS